MAFNYYKIFTWRQSLQTKRLVTAGRLYASFLLVLLYSCLLVWAAPIPATNSTEVPEELHARNPMRHPGKVHWRRSIPVADIVIGLSYCAIPIELAFFVLRLPSTTVQQRCVGGLFVAFILACGLGHFIDASVGESGPEIVVYIIRYFTAAVSLVTALCSPVVFSYSVKAIDDFSEKGALIEKQRDLFAQAQAITHLGSWEIHSNENSCLTEYEPDKLMIFASEEWLNVFGIHLGVFDHGLNRISTLTIDSLHDDDIHDENESLLPEAREENVQGARGILRSSDRALTPTPTNSPHSSRAAPPSVDPSLSSASSRYPRIAYSKLLPPNTDFTSISFPFSRYTACIAAEDLASMHSRMTAAIEDGQPFHCVQRIYREVDRRETYVQVYVKPVKAPKSSVVLSLRGTAQDITDRVQQELELIRAKEAALTESRHKDNFLSTMSHELRTPLTSIIGHVELMEETPLDDIQREYVSTARKGAVSLLALINDILDYSKLSANRIDLEARPTHLQEILLDIRAIVSNMGKDVDMIFEPYNGPLFISDGMRMKQILMNLINNAIKFTPEKGTVNIRNSHRINDDGEVEVQITVADSGIGMPEEVLQRLFKPFMQADATTSRRFGGTGLGLSIVKSLVTAMRGTISVSSQEGVGSTFVVNFIFPLAPVEPPPSIVVPTIRIPKRKLRLLVTEDNCVTQQLIRRMLREYATVEVANNGLEAVEFVTGAPVTDPKFTRSATLNTLLGTTISQPPPVLLKGDQIDVMLCDLNMPVMDGLEAVQRIRAWEESRRSTHPEYKPVYIIGLTANAFSTDRDSCLSAGMNDYLSKPFSKSALIEKVCNAIGDGD